MGDLKGNFNVNFMGTQGESKGGHQGGLQGEGDLKMNLRGDHKGNVKLDLTNFLHSFSYRLIFTVEPKLSSMPFTMIS